ncbi:MAG: zinc-dependent metalloprotease [Planctomycetota bacterium]|nr:zinc-dependent metalloprotease [Planctomycetota bacterium]
MQSDLNLNQFAPRAARLALAALLAFAAGGTLAVDHALAQDGPPPGARGGGPGGPGAEKDDDGLRPWAEVSKGYEKVTSTADGQSYYGIWVDKKKNQMLAELPRGWESQRQFFALTVASGEIFAGLQGGDLYCYWKRVDNRLMLVEPALETRSTGDQESKDSVKRIFTDRVLLDVPIIANGPSGQPVIDMDDLLVGKSATFFGVSGNKSLATIKTAKAFPKNVELAFEMPTRGGTLQILHYSISQIPENSGYQPRVADERIGYFTTAYRDLGKTGSDEKWVRYINRWRLEKRDPKLKLSPPKEPIVFYIENTTPVRYRRWVQQGVLEWNKAFEKIGIINAIQVFQQDAETGEHMDKDPEDVRYNFVRWLSNDVSTAIGPSRANPLTGEILDADIIMTDGWIRAFLGNFNNLLPELATESFSPETMAWLWKNPQWDPRVRLADPAQRDLLLAQRQGAGVLAYGGHPLGMAVQRAQDAQANGEINRTFGTREYDGLLNRFSQINGLCMAGRGKALDIAMMQMQMEILGFDTPEDWAAAAPDGQSGDALDGMPEWFIGPLLADVVAHEVGHTLGLRHNFKASSVYTLAQINSPEFKGKKAFAGSVMDYIGVNINLPDQATLDALAKQQAEADKTAKKDEGEEKKDEAKDEGKKDDKKDKKNGKNEPRKIVPQPLGDYTMIDIGPYDMWAIEYGYGSEDLKKVLSRSAEPELAYLTDEDTIGPDPLARRYDFAADPLTFAKGQMTLAKYHRGRIIEKYVKDGESWAKARRGYNVTLGLHTSALSIMSNWVGGTHVNRSRKGDPNAKPPLEVVPAEQQREALKFVIDNAFFDESFGLTPELLERMTVDKWADNGGMSDYFQESAWPIHDRIMGIQSSALTMLMNPTTLRRVYDNELRLSGDKDMITLPEVLDSVGAAIWKELDGKLEGGTPRKPAISSLRRNLQREHLERLIGLTTPDAIGGAVYKPISNLAFARLRLLRDKIGSIVGDGSKPGRFDPYTFAHLNEAKVRLDSVLNAQYLYNANQVGGGGTTIIMLGKDGKPVNDATESLPPLDEPNRR